MICRKEKRKSALMNPFFIAIMNILKESEKVHLDRVKEILVKAINASRIDVTDLSVTL